MPVSRNHRADGTPRSVSSRRGETRKLIPGENDLGTLRPDLARELVDLDPRSVTPGSNVKAFWMCTKGHKNEMAISLRNRGRSCSYCAGKKVLAGTNDLASGFPEIAKEAHGWNPTTVTSFSNKKMEWRCSKNHLWKANVNNRTSQGQGCPFCSNKKVLAGFNDLQFTHPEIARELVDEDPSKIMFGSNKTFTWRCQNGHTWRESPNHRNGRPCLSCVPRLGVLRVGVNDLLSSDSNLANEAFGWDPSTVIKSSTKKFSWRCSRGHIWEASVHKRVKLGRGCPVCANQKVETGFNDLMTTHPEIAELAHGWDPKKVVAGSGKKLTFKCPEKSHIFKMAVNSVVSGTRCNVCENKAVSPGINDLATLNPKLASQALGWDPSTVVPGSHSLKAWRCELGHVWKAVVKSREKNGCPFCANRKVLAGFNDLKSRFPDIADESFGWEPSRVVFASTAKKRWRCVEGHEWTSTIKNRTQLGRGCPSCAQTGFDPNLDAWIYFIKHERWEMLQIGITNFPDQRLGTHAKLGWELLDIRGPIKGALAAYWETEILRYIKSQGVKLDTGTEYGKFTGFTEAWKTKDFQFDKLVEVMEIIRNQ